MEPVNSKSMLHFVCNEMNKLSEQTAKFAKKELSNGEIVIFTNVARTQAALASQAHNLLTYEVKRAEVQMKLTAHNAIYKDGLKLREVETKNFEETK